MGCDLISRCQSFNLSQWSTILPILPRIAFPLDAPPSPRLCKPVPSSLQWLLPGLLRIASLPIHLHLFDSSGPLPAAFFTITLQACCQQFETGSLLRTASLDHRGIFTFGLPHEQSRFSLWCYCC